MLPIAAVAADALGQIGPLAKGAVPTLVAIVRDTEGRVDDHFGSKSNEDVRASAVAAIVKIHPEYPELTALLREAFQQGGIVRDETARSLTQLGDRAAHIVPRQTTDLFVASAILCARPNDKKALDTLISQLRSTNGVYDEDDWNTVQRALQQVGPSAHRVVPVLIQILKQERFGTWRERKGAAETCSLLGEYARDAEAALVASLDEEEEEDIREAMIRALQEISLPDSPRLHSALEHDDPRVRSGAIRVLGKHRNHVLLLTKALGDSSASVRLAAIRTLGELGNYAAPTIPALKHLLDDEYITLRRAASQTLKTLEPQ